MAIVTGANQAKFGQNKDLRDYLLGTGDRILVEASPLDRIWGIGLAADDPRAEQVSTWQGQNLLVGGRGNVISSLAVEAVR